jgi:glutathione S-transferase
VIFHIATTREWAAAQADGSYTRSTRGRSLDEVGFIHCSYGNQVAVVAAAIYGDCEEPLVLLHIEPTAVGSEIRVENLDGGDEQFPHIYGPLPTSAVATCEPYAPGRG